jgi:hypothetical protein
LLKLLRRLTSVSASVTLQPVNQEASIQYSVSLGEWIDDAFNLRLGTGSIERSGIFVMQKPQMATSCSFSTVPAFLLLHHNPR